MAADTAKRMIEAVRDAGYCASPRTARDGLLSALRTLVKAGPSEGMIAAYNGALKAYIEGTPENERQWRKRRTSGGTWSGYRISPQEKAACRTRAMVNALIREIEEEA